MDYWTMHWELLLLLLSTSIASLISSLSWYSFYKAHLQDSKRLSPRLFTVTYNVISRIIQLYL